MNVMNFQGKKRTKNILESPPVLAILFILLLFFAWGVIRFLGKLRDTSKNRQSAYLKVEELKKTKDRLSSDIESLQTDQGIEENIREKFGLVKEGEGLIVVVDDKNAKVNADGQSRNWFAKIFRNWFK